MKARTGMRPAPIAGIVDGSVGEKLGGWRPSDGTRPHADRPIVTILLAPDGAPLHSEPAGILFPATALTALQKASSEVGAAAHFTVMFPTQRLDAWRLSNGTLLANLLLRRPGDAERAALHGPVLDGAVLAPQHARPQRAESAIAEKEDRPETVPPEPEIAPAARPPIIEPEPEEQPAPAGPETQEHPRPAAEVMPGRVQPDQAAEPERPQLARRRLVIARLFTVGLVLVALAALLAPLGLVPTFGSAARSSKTSATAAASPRSRPDRAPGQPAISRIQLSYAGDLHYQSAGPAVARLQARLRQLHYYNYPDLTGYFGDATYGAVWTFQRQRHLATNGVADKGTIAALNACDASCTY